MISSPLLPLPDAPTDFLGSPFFTTAHFPQTPQSSQIVTPSIARSPDVETDYFEGSFDAITIPKLELDGVPLHFLDGDFEYQSPYDTYTPSTTATYLPLHPPTYEFDDSTRTPSVVDAFTPSPSVSEFDEIIHTPSIIDAFTPHPSIYEFEDTTRTPSLIDVLPPRHHLVHEFDNASVLSLSNSPAISTPPLQMPWSACICGCGGAPCIIQRQYRRPKGDALEDNRIGELIRFDINDSCGMLLRNALRGQYKGLSGRDDPMFVGSRTSISIRIEWPDCPPWAQQMRTKDWKRKPSPITKAKLSTEVAKKVKRFLEDMRRTQRSLRGYQEEDSPCHVDFDNLVLVALEHVSLASWQPHLRLI